MSWFSVDKNGLRQLMDGRGKAFVVRELVQNCIDEPDVTEVDIQITPVPGKPLVRLVVRDDAPEGFYDLRHAYTLYAKTRKRPDCEKRGRFNLGEKQALAIAREARIVTTTGVVDFYKNGSRSVRRTETTDQGSRVEMVIPATRAEMDQMLKATSTFILPPGIRVTLNDATVTRPTAVEIIEATLTTEYEDEQGQWKRSQRKTKVEVYEPKDGHPPMLYEMGLPVVELEGGDPWHLNVMQRVPLNSDRDNVSPAFIRDLRAEVLNKLAGNLTEDQAAESWVSDATDDERVEPVAVRTVITKRFGDKAVVADPSDPESRERAIQAGYTIVPARAMSRATWANVRAAGAVPSSSQVFASVAVGATEIPPAERTEGMSIVKGIAERMVHAVQRRDVSVRFVKSQADSGAQWAEMPTPKLTFNVTRLGKAWFRPENLDKQIELIIHEMGHAGGGHLDKSYIDALCQIGGALFKLDRRAMLVEINHRA